MGEPLFLAQKEQPALFIYLLILIFMKKCQDELCKRLKIIRKMVEKYSIDEAFVDLSGLRGLYHKSYEKIAKMIKDDIYNELKFLFQLV